MVGVARAIDVGWGNTKFTKAGPDGKIVGDLFPSVTQWSATDPTRSVIGDKRNTVAIAIDGMFYEVGPGIAAARGRYRATNMHDGYVETPEYSALVKGALHYIAEDRIDVLVMGLPVKHLVAKRASLERQWTGEHELPSGRRIVVGKVQVFAQPQGALVHYSRTSGQESVRRNDLNLVIDPGQRTFDWIVSRGMILHQGQSSSTDRGMHDVLCAIADVISAELGEEYRDLDAIDAALRRKKPMVLYQQRFDLKRFAPIIAQVTREAVARLLESIRDLASIQNILLVGGGAHLFKPAVIEAFRKHRITDVENPVFANVNGFQAIADEILARQASKRATATQPVGDTA